MLSIRASTLACCAMLQPAFAEEFEPYTVSDRQMKAIEEAIGRELKDPYSAVYEGLRASVDSVEMVHVCGFVNAKNSFGAFSGRTPFYISIVPFEEPKSPMVMQQVFSEHPNVVAQVLEICREMSVALN